MYVNPRQNASKSRNERLDSVESASYVASAVPALMVLVDVTRISPSIANVCFSPGFNEPTAQVRVPASMVEAPL